MHNSIEAEYSTKGSEATTDSIIKVDGLRKTYQTGNDTTKAVNDVTFSIQPGTVVGLLGPNGAGKTTTIKSMLGLVVPTKGTVTICETNVHDAPRKTYRNTSAMLEGARNVYWKLTVEENLEFFTALGGRSPDSMNTRHNQLLDQFALRQKAEETVNDLSQGMKQKVSLACALARKTPVVFLDEPALGLDVESTIELRRELQRLVKQESTTVVLSSHDMDIIQAVCDRVIIMNNGDIVADEGVADLIDLFRTQAYRIMVKDLPIEAHDHLKTTFDAEEFETVGEQTRFTVSLPEGHALYDVMDALRNADAVPGSVESIEPDLEDVFIEVTGSGRE